jgi:hypothetical protein
VGRNEADQQNSGARRNVPAAPELLPSNCQYVPVAVRFNFQILRSQPTDAVGHTQTDATYLNSGTGVLIDQRIASARGHP